MTHVTMAFMIGVEVRMVPTKVIIYFHMMQSIGKGNMQSTWLSEI